MMSNSNLLRVAEVAQRLGLSTSKIYQLVAEHKIAHRRIGGAIRFEEADVREFVEASKQGRKSSDSWPSRSQPHPPPRERQSKTWF